MLDEMKPILEGTSLDIDVTAIADGLKIINNFKNYLIDQDIKG